MVGTAIGAAVSIGGALIGGSSANSAAKTQAAAADKAAQEQLQAAQLSAQTALGIYGSTKASLAPYANTGTAALNQLAMMYGLPVYTAPTAASQTPQIPGLNMGGSNSSGAFGNFSIPGGTGAAPTAADKIAWLKDYATHDGVGGSNAAVARYLQANAGLPPERQLAGLLQALGPNAAASLNSWVQQVSPAAQPGGPQGGPGSGQPGVPDFTAMLDALTKTPGYQFGLQQGGEALDRSAASRGLLLSGAQLKDAQKFGTNYAIQAGWNPYVSQLNSLAAVGENAAAGAGNAGTAAAGQVGSAYQTGAANAGSAQLAGAQATGAGQIAQGNIWTQALQGLGGVFSGAF